MIQEHAKPFTLRENSEWVRYVLWGAAIGMALLLTSAVGSPQREVGKIIGSAAGVLLLGFSGFVFRTRCITFDPARRIISIVSRGFRKASTEILEFDDVDRVVLLSTFDYDSDLMPANRWQPRWALALVCKERSVLLTFNPYLRKQQAMRDAMNVKRVLDIDMTGTVNESITHLTRVGRKIEAITLAAHDLNMTLNQAREHIESKDRTNSSGRGHHE